VPKAGLRQRQRIVEAESIRLHDVEACALSNVDRSLELPHHQSGFLGSQVERRRRVFDQRDNCDR
jgi:hypothetical protein